MKKLNGSFLIIKFSNHVCFHIPHKLQEKLLLFRLPYLEYDFMIPNIVRLNLAVLKTSEASQENTRGGVLC